MKSSPGKLFLVLLFLSLSAALVSQPVASYQLIKGKNFVQSKNYYLLTLFDELPDVKKLLQADAILSQVAKQKTDAVSAALANCDRDAMCYSDAMKFGNAEIKTIGDRLAHLYTNNNALGKLVAQHLIASGTYILLAKLPAKEMLVKAWEQDAMGINFTIGVYAEGKKANYPLTDSTSFSVRSPGYFTILYNTVSLLSVQAKTNHSFYGVPMNSALYLLEMNEREQAGDYEPMSTTVNKAAFEKVKTTRWASYPYSVILVPGSGPEDPRTALSAESILRCRLATIQYQNHDAPFIVVSGGKVHPYKTKCNEAEEMKKYLIEKLGIPASAVIMEPHARHTTTNMRNTVRLMYRYGFPMNKPGVTCTTRGQSQMIGTTLIERCMRELEHAPYRNGKRLSETAIEFYPLPEALHIDPTEPMDP